MKKAALAVGVFAVLLGGAAAGAATPSRVSSMSPLVLKPATEISTEIPAPPPRTPTAYIAAPGNAAAFSDAEAADGQLRHFPGPPPPPPQPNAVGIALNDASGILTIVGTPKNDNIVVSKSANGSVTVTANTKAQTFDPGKVKSLVLYGGDGNDTISNNTDLPSTIDGGNGDDVLNGGSGDDFIIGNYGQDQIYGNDGNDILWGSGGSDKIYGGKGDDILYGHGGNDELHGGDGRDVLNGGSGDDKLYGDAGQDLLVSVGAGHDTLTGGSQWDNYWVDANDTITDASPDEIKLGYVHRISSFRAVVQTPDGNTKPVTTQVGLEPKGENLPDPKHLASDTDVALKNFSDHPLFAKSGPSKNDIQQGGVGDCYFVSRLAALADADPEYIRKAIAPLGDGSYAVRLIRNGQPDYIRVDADLWTMTNGVPRYADVGVDGALWAPLIEKAYAIARRDSADYAAIAGGNGQTLSTLGTTGDDWVIPDSLSAQALIDWNKQGQPAGSTQQKVQDGVTQLLTWIKQQRDAGKPMTTGAISGVSDSTTLQVDDPSTPKYESTYRRGQHIYMVDHVEVDPQTGKPIALVLKNPYYIQLVTMKDFLHIYYLIGRAGLVAEN